jgi:hypothetical protein
MEDDFWQSMLVQELVKQLKQEQMVSSATGKTTFDHPSGQHNDLAIAWELSIHGCMPFTNKAPRSPVVIGYSATDAGWREFEQQQLGLEDISKVKIMDNVLRRLKGLGPGVTIAEIRYDD